MITIKHRRFDWETTVFFLTMVLLFDAILYSSFNWSISLLAIIIGLALLSVGLVQPKRRF